MKDIGKLISCIVTWENKWGHMAKEHSTDLHPGWKIAAFIELCPSEVEDMIYQAVDEVSEKYEKVKQRVTSWAANKAAAKGPTPMDIGEVDGYRCEECDVDAVNSSMQCHNCGGWGHASRSCPSERKGGKGGKYRGKRKGNPTETAKGKGKGKGFQGACFNCGKPGHPAWECRSRPVGANAVEEEEGDNGVQAGAVETGTVWNIGAVECRAKEASRTTRRPGWRC